MLITLLAWLYISLSCFFWGGAFFHCIKKISGDQDTSLNFSFICLLGLAGITILASVLSLFMPLGGWSFQVILLVGDIVVLLFKPSGFLFTDLKKQFTGIHPVLIFLFFSCVIMVLVMSTWTISHPDTLTYHAQTIQWIEKYKAVPGIANLHIRYGYQGLWFVSCAVFSFGFLKLPGVNLVNSLVLCWYFLFLIQKINESIFSNKGRVPGIAWLILGALSVWSYTQVRLTATSASPDFIATIFVWATFFLLLEAGRNKQNTQWVTIFLFSLFAITLKLSAIPIILVALYAMIGLIRLKRFRAFALSCLIAVTLFSAYFARNVISSGYLLFPSPFPDLVNVDWKVDRAHTTLERNYIRAYARYPVDHTPQAIDANLSMKLSQWVPLWWKNQSAADKVCVLLFVLGLISSLIFVKLMIYPGNSIVALITGLAGCIFWFIQAPDPRFGFGFLIGFPAIVVSGLMRRYFAAEKMHLKSILTICCILLSLAIAVYDVYRLKKFFAPAQLIKALGLKKNSFQIIQCNGIEFRVPDKDNQCGDANVPCIYTDCNEFMPRGNNVTDGFRPSGR